MKKNKLPVYLGLMLSMSFWGMSYIWINIVFRCYGPITTVLLRLIIASPLMYLLAKIFKKLDRIERGDFRFFLLLSLLQPFLYFLCESFGLKLVSPTAAAVIISTIPLFTPFAAFYFFKEKFSRLNIIGMTAAFFGVLLVVVKGDFSLAASPLGVLLLFSAVLMAVGYNMILRKIGIKYNAITIVTYQNILGILGFLPLFLFLELGHFLKAVPTTEVLISLGLLAFLASSVAYVLYAYAVKILGASLACMFTNIMPVFTAISAWIVLHEIITPRMMVGIFVVISGLFISQLKGTK